MITAHADVVGSLLRPAWLLAAQERLRAGEISCAAYKSIEDRAVDAAVAQQEAAGLEVLTDGEMRRLSFQSQMVAAVDGFGAWDLNAFLWGDWHGQGEVGDSHASALRISASSRRCAAAARSRPKSSSTCARARRARPK